MRRRHGPETGRDDLTAQRAREHAVEQRAEPGRRAIGTQAQPQQGIGLRIEAPHDVHELRAECRDELLAGGERPHGVAHRDPSRADLSLKDEAAGTGEIAEEVDDERVTASDGVKHR